MSVVDSAAHRNLALQLARESIVVLENTNSALPFTHNPNKGITTVAVIGPHANSTDALCSNYHGQLPNVISPLLGIQNKAQAYGWAVDYAAGCPMTKNDTSGFDYAVGVAAQADVALVVSTCATFSCGDFAPTTCGGL